MDPSDAGYGEDDTTTAITTAITTATAAATQLQQMDHIEVYDPGG